MTRLTNYYLVTNLGPCFNIYLYLYLHTGVDPLKVVFEGVQGGLPHKAQNLSWLNPT